MIWQKNKRTEKSIGGRPPLNLQCQVTVYGPRVSSSQCQRQGKTWTTEGKWVCAQHTPEAAQRREEKSMQRYEAYKARLNAKFQRVDDYRDALLNIEASTRDRAGLQNLARAVLKKHGDLE